MTVRAALLLAFLALAGCEVAQGGLESSVRPLPRPAGTAAPEISAESQRLAAFYTRLEQGQRVRGLLRTDGGTVDAPFNERNLAENFLSIAFFDENPGNQIRTGAAPVPTVLRKWSGPVRLGLRFGASVPEEDRARQAMHARDYARRLAAVTGHPIRFVGSEGENFTVHVVNEEERRALAPVLARTIRGFDATTADTVRDMPQSVYCLVIAFSGASPVSYSRAVAIIRQELPPASWRACLHEEVAQGLGLPNDSPRARPSIFNDDEEFALLTRHDELLLSILYDARLPAGSTAAEAAPLIRRLAAEKLGAGPV
ncbi:MAG: DUF2927 domain-containing protein [Pseudomonadota bacterium]